MFDSIKNIFARSSLGDLEISMRAIGALEPEIQKRSDDELRAESLKLKEQAGSGTDIDELLPRAFALVREAAHRTLKQRPYDVQLMGGVALHKGSVAEMMTGEGKTLAAVAPAYLNALRGLGVHVVTVNEYLARRDAVWMGQIYRALGLSVACLVPSAAFLYDPEWKVPEDGKELIDKERDATGNFLVQQEFLRPVTRREAYLADVTYGTNHEFGFDYLRDNLAYGLMDQVQRGHHFAIIDEVDSILIDEARTPLIIAAPDVQSSEFYKTFARVAQNLKKEEDYDVDEKRRSVAITQEGIEKVERMIGIQNIYAPEHLRLVHYLEESLRAKALFQKDKDYVVKNGEVIIVDEFTGRMLHGRRYSAGLHQAIEAKESVRVQEESKTYAKISIQNYFRMYERIAGMTGTAQTSAEEFHKVYKLDVVSIPSNKQFIRADNPDAIYKSGKAKWEAITQDISERYKKGQPILVGTTSIEKNEVLSAMLSQANVPHEVLNAKNNEREGAVIAQAGRRGAVTVATNMAGRGVDIILGGNPPVPGEAETVRSLGGLHVVGTERHEARRIDNQLRGRAGRQGDPGSSQFFMSLDDDLLRIFGGDKIKSMMERFDLPEDQPIQVGFVSKAVAQAQAKVEGANFDMRKHLLEYDDVLNKQRSSVYRTRKEILESFNKNELAKIVYDAAYAHVEGVWQMELSVEANKHIRQAQGEEVSAEGEMSASEKVKALLKETGIATEATPSPENITDAEDLKDLVTKRSVEACTDPQTLPRVLSILDILWMSHLENLEALSESVGLRAYGQKDPLVEYRQEAHRLFKDFWLNWNAWIFTNVFKMAGSSPQNANHPMNQNPSGYTLNPNSSKVGRNDPCPCGAVNPATGQVYKYKKCGLINASHHKK